MGLICSCFRAGDFEEHAHSNVSVCRHCICIRCLAQQMIHVYTATFQRGQVRVVPSSAQETSSLAPASLVPESSLSDTYRSPPRPLAYDDPRCSHLQRDGLVLRRDKSSSHLHEEYEPLITGPNMESKNRAEKLGGLKPGVWSELYCIKSSLKHQLEEVSSGVTYTFPSSKEEDVCPTCLDEYTSENPRIVMQCSHHFHLNCIYEWMERSEACPICGKVMIFNETT